MTVSLVGYVAGFSTTNADINVALPGGSASGDRAVAMCMGEAPGYTFTPAGFTLIDGPTSVDQAEIRTAWRVLDATDISNGYLVMPGEPGFHENHYQIWVAHSTGGTPIIDGHLTRAASDFTESACVVEAPVITNAGTGDLVCIALGARDSGTSWSSTPSGIVVDQNTPTTWLAVYAYHYFQSGTGTTSNQSAIINSVGGYSREMAGAVGLQDVGGAAILGKPFGRVMRRH